jgi:hypothetical protein
LHNKVESMILCLNGGECDKLLKARACADHSSTKEEDVTTGGTASTRIGGWAVYIVESMES